MECVLLHPSSKLVSAARARELSEDDCQKLIDFASVYGRSVRQRSVRQETQYYGEGRNIAILLLWDQFASSKSDAARDETHDNSDVPLQHAVPSTEDIDAESQDQDSDIEYDSDESVENDVTSTVGYDEPQLASEALFLIGRRSRFGIVSFAAVFWAVTQRSPPPPPPVPFGGIVAWRPKKRLRRRLQVRKDDPFQWEIYSVVDCAQCLPSHWNDWNRNDWNRNDWNWNEPTTGSILHLKQCALWHCTRVIRHSCYKTRVPYGTRVRKHAYNLLAHLPNDAYLELIGIKHKKYLRIFWLNIGFLFA